MIEIGDLISYGKYYIHSRFTKLTNFINKELKFRYLPEIISITNNNDIPFSSFMIRLNKKIPHYLINKVIINKNFILLKMDNNKHLLFKINNLKVKSTFYPGFIKLNCNTWHIIKVFEIVITITENLLNKTGNSKSLYFIKNKEINNKNTFLENLSNKLKIKIKEFEKNFYNFFLLYNLSNLHSKTLLINKLKFSIKSLKSLGLGLTPSGDDYIEGVLSFLSIVNSKMTLKLKNVIFKASKTKNPIVNSYHKSVYLNHFDDIMVKYLNIINYLILNETSKINLNNRNFNKLIESILQIISRGSTSGADFLTGFLSSMKIFLKYLKKRKNCFI